MGGFFLFYHFLKKTKLRLISSGFYPALRTPSFRHPKDKKIIPKVQQNYFYFSVGY